MGDFGRKTLSRIYEHQRLPKALETASICVACNIARHLTGESFRQFSVRLSDSALFQWFTRIHHFTNKKAISKSALDRFSKMFDESMIAKILLEWQSSFLTTSNKTEEIGLNEPMSFRDTFLDSTCIKANIHFPVDWVLLRDAVRIPAKWGRQSC